MSKRIVQVDPWLNEAQWVARDHNPPPVATAYLVDFVVQLSAYRALWLRTRWLLLVIGIAFGTVLSHFFSVGIFGSPSQ